VAGCQGKAHVSSTIVFNKDPWVTLTVEVFQRIGSGDLGPASTYHETPFVSVRIPLPSSTGSRTEPWRNTCKNLGKCFDNPTDLLEGKV
jgi:hypothetical protein